MIGPSRSNPLGFLHLKKTNNTLYMASIIEVGQFDDAQELPTTLSVDPRAGHPYIDTAGYDSDDLPLPEESDYEDEIDEEYDENRVEDEDWEVVEGGLILQTQAEI